MLETVTVEPFAATNTTAVHHDLQATELVTINSSPLRIGCLPRPRVIKRKNNRYMLPQSPESPSPRAANKAHSSAASSHPSHSRALHKKDFVHVDSKSVNWVILRGINKLSDECQFLSFKSREWLGGGRQQVHGLPVSYSTIAIYNLYWLSI